MEPPGSTPTAPDPEVSRSRRAWFGLTAAVVGGLGISDVTGDEPGFGWAQLAFAATAATAAMVPRFAGWVDAPLVRRRKQRAELDTPDRG